MLYLAILRKSCPIWNGQLLISCSVWKCTVFFFCVLYMYMVESYWIALDSHTDTQEWRNLQFLPIKTPPFPLSAIDLWHFIMEASPLQPNRQSGQAASDSLTVCLNSSWRPCFHSPRQTPSARAAQLLRVYLHLDLPSLSEVYLLVCACMYAHTNLKSPVAVMLSCV